MNGLPLSLTIRSGPPRAAAPQQPVAAWFIAGDDPRVWFGEMTRWGVALARARLYLVPVSKSDRQACGALVTLSDGTAPKTDSTLRAEPYCRVGGKLYLPANACLYPDVSPSELDGLLTYDVHVLHPTAGLSGFRFADAKAPANLLARPPRRKTEWNRAQQGGTVYGRLIGVEPEAVMSIQTLFANARGDIGSQAPQLPQSPSNTGSPGRDAEPKGMLERLAAGMSRLFGPLMGGSGAKEPPPAQVPAGESLEDRRNREIGRLLSMFNDNPDEGLRHAIPFGGGASRGVSRPGGSLIPHNADFNLSRLRGGNAADSWSIPEDLREKLREQYTKAANRELSLGRHRRAAYIFSELLGDYASAANALKQGRYFREAAIVYRDMLKNRLAEAACLESGGLIMEAIAVRDELQQWLESARLYELLDFPQEARKSYGRAVDAEVVRKNPMGAAKLLVEKLSEPDRALAVLAAAWPGAPQAQQCLAEQFALQSRLGRHPASVKLIQSLRTATLSDDQAKQAAHVLAKISGNYPDPVCRAKAADSVRVIAGGRLPRVAFDIARDLAHSVSVLASEDRLLARDTLRFIEQRRAKERPATSTNIGKKPLLKKRFRLPGAVWRAASSMGGDIFYAVGVATSGEITLVRGTWSEAVQVKGWPNRPLPLIHLEAPYPATQPLLVALYGAPRPQILGMRQLSENRYFPDKITAGTPEWLPDDMAGFCYDEHGTVCVIATKENDDATLTLYGSSGALLAQYPIERLAANREKRWLSMAARGECIFAANGANRLMVFYHGKQDSLDLPHAIQGVAVSAPFTRLRVAVAMEAGGVVLWPTPQQHTVQCNFGEGMIRPMLAFTRGGALVAVTKAEIRIFSTRDETLRILSNSPGPGRPPIAVVPGAGLNDFAIFLENGEVLVNQVPE